ncbi:MAG: glycine/betaine ABC transporter substrate-binding protein, partial [Gammaproteobacteria bacterium]|nr:glycine/betaine ABC transporter substrate-binding protein [Gammaproteobacteria bacterium]
MRKSILSLTFGIAVCLSSGAAFGAEKVNIGAPSWTGAQAIAALLQAVVVERIGGEANLVPGNNATIFQGMDQGKGDIDVHPDVWLPNQQSFTQKYVDGTGSVQLSKNSYEGNQGFCVPENFGKANSITDIADLGRPDVAMKMDSDGNGKGEMWIGAPGWASANVNEVKVRDYDLLSFIDPIRAEESV